MWRRLVKGAVVLVLVVVVIVASQLVRPAQAIPVTDPTHTIGSQLETGDALVAILDRSCGDCHSSSTAWPRYMQVAPLSWVAALAEKDGRKAVDFSEWTGYSPEQRRSLLVLSCQTASTGTMPIRAYTWLRPAARLSPQDIETICAASHQPEASAERASGSP
jgi:heme-binding protein